MWYFPKNQFLEIGVYLGGSIDMWNYYFDSKCTIIGLDIDPKCKLLEKYPVIYITIIIK